MDKGELRMFVTTAKERAPIRMEIITDPVELAEGRKRFEQFRRNLDWLKVHASEVYSQNRGKYFCVAGEELVVADSSPEALQKGRAAHPNDEGAFVRYVAPEKRVWIYAHQRRVVSV
jgi:hypothetical protein